MTFFSCISYFKKSKAYFIQFNKFLLNGYFPFNRAIRLKLSADGSNTPASVEDDPVLVVDPEPPRIDMRPKSPNPPP